MHNKEQEKKNREYLKRVNRCISCQKQDSYTIGGRSYCFDCVTKRREINARYRESHREQIKLKEAELRNNRKRLGLCVRCGLEIKKGDDSVYCDRCKGIKRKEKKRYSNKGVNYPRGANGFCWRCNKKPAIDGKKLCEDCYSKQLMYLEKAMEVNRNGKVS